MNEKANILIKYFVEGQKIRQISRDSSFSRNTVRKYIRDHEDNLKDLEKTKNREEILMLIESLVEKPKYNSKNRNRYKLTQTIKDEIANCIEINKKRKSRGQHKQLRKKIDIYEFLKDKGYDIGYTTVCNYIRSNYEQSGKEAFIKQRYLPGQTLQFDYGEVKLIIDGKMKKINLALFTTGYGFFNYGKLYHNKKMVSFLDAHVSAFNSLGGVHHEIVYDNLKQAVKRFVGPTEKLANDDLVKLSLYYGFNYRFCNVRRGNEKGKVEKGIEFIRRRVFSQKDTFSSLKEANQYLTERLKHINSLEKRYLDYKSPVEFLNEEKEYLKPLKPNYEVCIQKENRVNKYSLITVEQNKYSVPDHLVGKFVMSRIYSDKIMVFYKDKLVASHERIYDLHKASIDINHYLLTLKRKPGALKNSLAFQQMAPDLKVIYELYYSNYTKKTKEFIELLSLVREYNLDLIKKAIETLAKNKVSMVNTANIKLLVQKENTPEIELSDEINHNSLKLLKQWDSVFNLDEREMVQ